MNGIDAFGRMNFTIKLNWIITPLLRTILSFGSPRRQTSEGFENIAIVKHLPDRSVPQDWLGISGLARKSVQ